MRKNLLFAFIIFSSFLFSQTSSVENEGRVKEYNFTSFSPKQNVVVTPELISLTSSKYRNHSEFGKVPFNAQCLDCIELIDKRTTGSRYFVKNGSNGSTFYIQQAHGELHFKNVNNDLITIDTRLAPELSQSGLYSAKNQEMPTSLNAITGTTSIKLNSFELIFNVHPKIFHVDGNIENQLFGNINITHTTFGEEGAFTANAWPGINRITIFDRGSIKTNFILTSVPSVPSNSGWMAFEDEINLPPGFKIIKDNVGKNTPEGFWQGDLKLISEVDYKELARWSTVIVNDNNRNSSNEMNAAYQLKNIGNTFFIRAMVRVNWLKNLSTIYPVTIDPLVSGTNTWSAGNIGFSPYAPGNGFCGSSTGFCLGGPLNVVFPGGATITNAIWSSQYIAIFPTYMSDGGFRMIGPCGELPIPNNWLNCNVASSGTCAGSNLGVASLATCVAASCNTTNVAFQTKNIHCIFPAGGSCNTARLYVPNNSWIVTVQGQQLATLGNTLTGNGSQTIAATCYGSVTLNPSALYGVPPYNYLWSPGGSTAPTITFSPISVGNNTFTCLVTDACGISSTATFVVTNNCVLPLELTEYYLSYNGDVCDINWTTASEKNTDYFLIEKSNDGINYVYLEKAIAAGNSTQTKKYSVRDLYPNKDGVTYYRLKQFDKNNNEALLNLVHVLNPKTTEAQKISIQPNPAADRLDVYLPGNLLNRNVTLQVFDNTGKKSLALIVNRQHSKIAYNLGIESLMPGFYTLYAFDESGNTSKTTFIKN